MHSSPLEGKGLDLCDGRGLTRGNLGQWDLTGGDLGDRELARGNLGQWDLTRGDLGDRKLARGNLENREQDFVSLDSLEITSSNSSLVPPNHKFKGQHYIFNLCKKIIFQVKALKDLL